MDQEAAAKAAVQEALRAQLEEAEVASQGEGATPESESPSKDGGKRSSVSSPNARSRRVSNVNTAVGKSRSSVSTPASGANSTQDLQATNMLNGTATPINKSSPIPPYGLFDLFLYGDESERVVINNAQAILPPPKISLAEMALVLPPSQEFQIIRRPYPRMARR